MKGGKLGNGRSREMANAFPDGWGRIPDNPIIAATIAALFKGGRAARLLIGGWRADGRGRPTYGHAVDGGGEIVVSVDPCALPDGAGGPSGQWAQVEGISPLTLDVLLGVLAQACAHLPDDRSATALATPVRVTARAILRSKGLLQWGAEGAALRRRIDGEIMRLHSLRFDMRRTHDGAPASWRSNAGATADERLRLFDIVESSTIPSARKAGARAPETAWVIRPGWWFGTGQTIEDGIRFAPIPQPVLRFDHRRNRGSAVLAKKIGLATSMMWGGLRPPQPLQRRICDLLEDIGELPRRDARGDGWGARMRKRLVHAVLLLREAGVLAGVEWPAGRESDTGDRGKGWVDTWLNGGIALEGPAGADLSGGASVTHSGKMRRTTRTASGLLELYRGSVIRAMRAERNMPQYRLARELGISAAYLSQIENERRMASQAVLGRIASWASRSGGEVHERPDAIAPLEFAASRWRKAANGGRHTAAGRLLQGTAPCGPTGKDERT